MMANPQEPPKKRPSAEAPADPKQAASSSVPAHIAARYLIDKDRYHFPDRQAAFIDRGARFTVQSQNAVVLKDLIAIAEARGWRGVQVSGTEQFRREAWTAARAAGLEVKGYSPSSLERAARERAGALSAFPARERDGNFSPPAEAGERQTATARARAQATAEAIRSAATTREELQLKFPELSEAVFKRLDTHEEFAQAFIKAGLVREGDRQQVIAFMRERLAQELERGELPRAPNDRRVKRLIGRAVARAGADLGVDRGSTAPRITPSERAAVEQGRGGR